MKLASIVLLSSLTLFSTAGQASNNTYIYSNTEYCQLAKNNASEIHLDAYSRKLGFTPSETECRLLTNAKVSNSGMAAEADVTKLLREALKGSILRPSAGLQRKLQALPEQERILVLKQLFS